MRIFYSAHCGVRTNNPSTQNIQDVNAIVRAAIVTIRDPQALKCCD